MSHPLFLQIDDRTAFPVDEIKYVRMQRDPGLPALQEAPDILTVWFKTGGCLTIPDMTVEGFMERLGASIDLKPPY